MFSWGIWLNLWRELWEVNCQWNVVVGCRYFAENWWLPFWYLSRCHDAVQGLIVVWNGSETVKRKTYYWYFRSGDFIEVEVLIIERDISMAAQLWGVTLSGCGSQVCGKDFVLRRNVSSRFESILGNNHRIPLGQYSYFWPAYEREFVRITIWTFLDWTTVSPYQMLFR